MIAKLSVGLKKLHIVVMKMVSSAILIRMTGIMTDNFPILISTKNNKHLSKVKVLECTKVS
jgi:hypothetical protein